jgi:hypothetical protein
MFWFKLYYSKNEPVQLGIEGVVMALDRGWDALLCRETSRVARSELYNEPSD